MKRIGPPPKQDDGPTAEAALAADPRAGRSNLSHSRQRAQAVWPVGVVRAEERFGLFRGAAPVVAAILAWVAWRAIRCTYYHRDSVMRASHIRTCKPKCRFGFAVAGHLACL
jgi:hypothetical protein